MKNCFTLLLSIVVLMACVSSKSVIPTTSLEQTLPVQQGVINGVLKNGMRYIVLPNNTPENQVSLKMIVNAGSMHEQDDQKGIAHLVEHMAFNGTALYPANSIIKQQEKLGMTFGKDVNATTSYNATSYYLHLPNNSDTLLNEAFQMLSQQASALIFDPVELEKERPVIEEEWRRRLSMRARLSEKIQKITLSGSRYVERNPIGDMALVRHVDANRIKAFWESWYHPNNMTLVAVGNVSEEQIKALLNTHFQHLNEKSLPQAPDFSINLPDSSSFHSVSDSELITESIIVNFIEHSPHVTSKQQLHQQLVKEIAITMLQDRLHSQYQAGGEHINKLFAFSSGIAMEYSNTRLFGILSEQSYLNAIKEIFSELSRFAHHGFTDYELTTVKQVFIKKYAMAHENESSVSNRSLLNRVSSYVQRNSPILSHIEKLKLQQELISSIDISEINSYLKTLVKTSHPLVIAQIKPENKHKLPNTQQVNNAWQQAILFPPKKLSRITIDKPLFEQNLPQIKVTKHEIFDNTHVWTLPNNTQVWFQPSDKWPDTLLLKWQGIGGTQHLEPENRRIAQIATSQLPRFGYNGFNVMQLELANAGKSINIGASVNQQTHQLAGSSSVASFEAWLQNAYLQITTPQTNDNIWKTNKKMMLNGIEGAQTLANTIFTRAWNDVLFTENPSLKMLTADELTPIHSEALLTAWQNIFSGAEQHQLVIVGNADPDWIINLASQYIGNLPVGSAKPAIKLPALTGAKEAIVVTEGIEPKATSLMYWLTDAIYSETLNRQTSILSRLISTRIRNELRESIGGVYTVSFNITADKNRDQVITSLRYNHQPERANELQQAALKVITHIHQQGITDSELNTLKEQSRHALNNENISDGTRLRWLSTNAMNNTYVSMPSDYLSWLDTLTAEDLFPIIQKIFTQPISLDAKHLPTGMNTFVDNK